MWIAIWVLLSTFVLVVAGWSYMILRQQKQAWAAFAKRHGLTFKKGTFFGPPLMEGQMGSHYVSFFIGRQDTSDTRSHRYVTVIEINLRVGLPTSAAIGTKETTGVVNILPLEFNVPPPEGATLWDKEWPARARDPGKFYAYMTPARVEALKSVFATKGVIALFFFDELDTLLRIETSDPLRDDKKLEKAMTRILGEASKLLPTDEERAQAEEERRVRGTTAKPVGAVGPTPASIPVPDKKEFNAPLKPLPQDDNRPK
jgi:hypothetical protein